ncbi:hypothetical protein ABIB83_007515 [Bradyrhizobium sp. I1.8.5]|uniref:hypothetical protein n=1 Tax=Bradyrhizobium sp. I1.8.5 TaxID=3156365 RepID=UPI003390A804
MITDALKKIVLDFESALLSGIRSGANEARLTKLRDRAFDQSRDDTLDPQFDHGNEADAEFTAWRWPERTMIISYRG